jgi:hypothetical protein
MIYPILVIQYAIKGHLEWSILHYYEDALQASGRLSELALAAQN